MTATADQFLDVCRSQLKVREQPPGSNDVLYTRWYPMVGEPWCAMFMSWCMDQVGGLGTLMVKHAYTPSGVTWFKSKGLWVTSKPRPGDIVYYDFPGPPDRTSHVGAVENVYADGTFDAIEGNTDTAGGRTGGRVMRQHRSKYVVGFGRPEFDTTDGGDDMPSAEQIAEQVWNRYKVYEKDGTLKKTYGAAMSDIYQGALSIDDGALAIAVCDQVWKRYKVRDAAGNLVPLLDAIQDILQDVNALRAGS